VREDESAARTNESSPAIYRWVRVFSIKMSPRSGRLKKGTLMSHSYVGNLMHCTFSTKDRSPFIDSNKELHRRKTFHEEFLELLNKHIIDYDSRYVVKLSRPLHGLPLLCRT